MESSKPPSGDARRFGGDFRGAGIWLSPWCREFSRAWRFNFPNRFSVPMVLDRRLASAARLAVTFQPDEVVLPVDGSNLLDPELASKIAPASLG